MSLAKATDIAIGLILTILIVSALCSGVNEAIAWVFKQRSKGLWKAIAKLIENSNTDVPSDPRPVADPEKTDKGQTLVQALYDSPFVVDSSRVAHDGKTLVAHLASSEFSQGLIHAAKEVAQAGASTLDQVVDGLGTSEAGKVVSQLRTEVGDDVEKVRKGIEDWFNTQMARLARVYRHRARIFAFFIGLLHLFFDETK